MPSTKFQLIWSLVMVMALSFTAIFVPYRLAFIEEYSLGFSIVEYFVDVIFLADLILTFFTAIYDNEHKLITNKKVIARNYLKGWFLIDLIAWYEYIYIYKYIYIYIVSQYIYLILTKTKEQARAQHQILFDYFV